MKPFTVPELQVMFSHEWPAALPRVVWRGLVIAGMGRQATDQSTFSETPVTTATQPNQLSDWDVSSRALSELLPAIYPKLTLMEFAQLRLSLTEMVSRGKWEPKITETHEGPSTDHQVELLHWLRRQLSLTAEAYGWRWEPGFLELLDLLVTLPETFQAWAQKHALVQREIQILVDWQKAGFTSGWLNDLLEILALSRATRSEGVRILELALEVLQLPPEILSSESTPMAVFELNQKTAWPAPEETPSRWLKRLEAARYPRQHRQDDRQAERLLTVQWPRGAKAQWTRHGDRAGVELKFFFDTHQQWQKFADESHALGASVERIFSANPQNDEGTLA